MPRLRLSALLVAFTLTALWLSTFASYSAAEDVRALVRLAVVIATGTEALYSAGARRAIWGGFFATLLAMATRAHFGSLVPRLTWLSQISMESVRIHSGNPADKKRLMENMYDTLQFVSWLLIAIAIGLLCSGIQRSHARNQGSTKS